MHSFETFTRPFTGQSLTTLVWEGHLAWVASHVGALLGYPGHGRRLVHHVLGDWNAEFAEGHDYLFLSGDALAALRAVGADGPTIAPTYARDSLLLLLEPGLHLVLTKAQRPIGVKLRRFLADEVLPQLARSGRYEPGCLANDLGVSEADARLWAATPTASNALALRSSLIERREARLWLRERSHTRWVDLCERRFRVAALYRALETIGPSMDPAARSALEVTAAELATGLSILPLLDPPDGDTPTEGQDDEERAA